MGMGVTKKGGSSLKKTPYALMYFYVVLLIIYVEAALNLYNSPVVQGAERR
jgi:hypothetical protein